MKYKFALLTLLLGVVSCPVTVFAEEPATEPVQEEQVIEKQEVLLDYKPDNLAIELPNSIDLALQPDNTYLYEGVIHIKGEEAYKVNINLKDTNVEYVNKDGTIVTGVASLGDTDLSYDEVLAGTDISLVVTVPEITSGGEFNANIGFNIDIYQEQEIQPEEPPVIEEEVIETLELSSETVSAGDLEAYPHLKSITITKDVISIEASAFDSLSELTDIYYLGSEEAWSSVFVGNLDRIAIHFAEEDEVPEVEPTEPIVDPEVPEVEPTEPTEEEVTDPEVDPTQPADEDVTDETPTDEAPVDEDVTNETEIEEPSSEDTQSEEPSSEEPANEESTTEEPSSEQPVSEEPIEEPAPEPLEEEVPEVSNEAESNGVDGVTE